ncbi:MAG: DNA polymerase IV, partial [Candidatus Curtissbacteria bacterium]|nr:DNA polymerase IV [Candidatus Curtissbacteria bacterium]
MRIIAHLDMDCFFAQVEERENPSIKGQPVVVGADPKGGGGRGVVSTANYEARKFGIHSGMPISWAWRACPQAVYLYPRHDFYSKVSARIREIIRNSLKNVSDAKLEQVSIDEFYLDLSGLKNFYFSQEFCHDIKDKIQQNEKLSCSIGLGPNKLIAKIASGFQKPSGLTVIPQNQVEKFLAPLQVETIPGVGPKTAVVLNHQRIKTIADLKNLSQEKLLSLFGKWGQGMFEASRGIDESEVSEIWERKTLGKQTTFAHDMGNFYFLKRELFDLCGQVWNEIAQEKLTPQMIEVTIRYFDFETHTRQKTLPKPL